MVSNASSPAIYHITHIDNLAGIVEDGCIWSDRRLLENGRNRVVIGLSNIKRRRLEEQWIPCHPGKRVGDFVPFYFCPRSPMLYFIYQKNDELAYQDGQERIVHLVSSVNHALAETLHQPWAFSDINAGVGYAKFCKDLASLSTFVDWKAVAAQWWRGPNVERDVMCKKMAEFLIHDCFPWSGVTEIGVIDKYVAAEVRDLLLHQPSNPPITVKRNWYY